MGCGASTYSNYPEENDSESGDEDKSKGISQNTNHTDTEHTISPLHEHDYSPNLSISQTPVHEIRENSVSLSRSERSSASSRKSSLTSEDKDSSLSNVSPTRSPSPFSLSASEEDMASSFPSKRSSASSTKSKSASSKHSSTRSIKSKGSNVAVKAELGEESSGTPSGKPDNKDDITNAALSGDMLLEYPLTAKVVRIFTSSTFTDTKIERNSLMEKVYPRLRTFCQEQGYDFQVVDMRWGVRDEATDDHMTSELCMNEITECKRLSTGPNFITFLGQKYGYRPFPPKIQAAEFENILKNLDKKEDSDLLKYWFIKDDNAVPPFYQLQPIRTKLIHYADNSDQDKKKQDRDAWWVAFERMQVVLRQAASKALSKQSDIHKYYWSVTEEEIYNGILQANDKDSGCYWFKRNIDDLAENTKDKMAKRFMDIAGSSADEEAQGLLNTLRNELVSKALPEKNVKEYNVKWTETGIDPTASQEHETYIQNFCSDIENVLKDMVDEGIKLREDREVKDPLVLECIQHLQFAQNKCKLFHGREKFLKLIKTNIAKRKPLVLCGEPGCGKTSLMAKLTSLMASWYPDTDVIVRFLGTTSSSSNTKSLLLSLCKQIDKLDGKRKKLPTDTKGLQDYFMNVLQNGKRPICIILDSLDQLTDFGGILREWVPTSLGSNTTFILSAIPSEEFRVVPQLTKVLPEKCFVDVPNMPPSDFNLILKEWLRNANRTLQVDQHSIVEKFCNLVKLPLYLKLTYDQAVSWKSYTQMDNIQLGHSVQETIHNLLDRVEKYHGKVLVTRALAYLTVSKNGLSINEIEDILSLDDVALSDIYQYHLPPLRRLPPLLWVRIQADIKDYLVNSGADGVQVIRWYHRQFQTVASERYLKDQNFKTEIQKVMVEYFLGRWSSGVLKPYVDKKGNSGEADRFVAAQPLLIKEDGDNSIYNLRKMSELPYHLALTKQMDLLKQHTLLNFDFIYQKLKATSLDVVLDDFNFALELLDDEEVKLVRDCLRLSRDALGVGLDHLPGQLTGRLMAEDTENMPAVVDLISKSTRPNFDSLLTTQGHLQTSGGPLVAKLAGHEGTVKSFDINKKGTRLISCGFDYTLRLWDISNGRHLECFDLKQHDFVQPMANTAVKFCKNEEWAFIVQPPWIFIWDLESGLCQHFIDSIPNDTAANGLGWHLWNQNDLLFAVIDEEMIVLDITTGNKVLKIKHPIAGKSPNDPMVQNNGKDFVGGFNNYLVVYRKWTNTVYISDYADFPKSTGSTIQVYSKKDIPNKFVLMSVTSGGLLACYHLVPQSVVVGKVPDPVVSTLDIYDIKTSTKLHRFPDIRHELFMGGMEILISTGPDTFMFTTQPAGKTKIHFCQVKDKTIKEIMEMGSTFIQYAVGCRDVAVLSFMNDASVMEVYDVRKAAAEATSGGGKGDAEIYNTEANDIKAFLPGSHRYVYFSTKDEEHAIWDVAARTCVRLMKTPFISYNGVFCNMTQMVANQTWQNTITHADLKEGKILHTAPVAWKVDDGHGGVGKVDNERVACIGPKSHQVSVYNIKTYKTECTIDGTNGVKLSGLVVSANGHVAIAGVAMDMKAMATGKTMASDGKVKPRHIHAFDLKAKKRLPDIVNNSTVPFNTAVMKMGACQQGVLTPDGKYFICPAYTETETGNVIFTVHTGAQRKVPKFEKCEIMQCMSYCRARSAVIGGSSEGMLILWNPASLKVMCKVQATENKNDITYMYPSHYSPLVGVISSTNKNLLNICDLQAGTVLMRYRSETEIASCLLTPGDRFLLMACRGRSGIVQLCVHKAEVQASLKEGATVEQHYLQLVEEEEPDIFGPPKKFDLC